MRVKHAAQAFVEYFQVLDLSSDSPKGTSSRQSLHALLSIDTLPLNASFGPHPQAHPVRASRNPEMWHLEIFDLEMSEARSSPCLRSRLGESAPEREGGII